MAESRAPRRRVPRVGNTDEVIFLPAPQQTTQRALPRSDAANAGQAAGPKGVSAHQFPGRRRQIVESNAAYTARKALTSIAGQPLPPRPVSNTPRLSLSALKQALLSRVLVSRRLSGHALLLLLAGIIAVGGGFPLRPHAETASDAEEGHAHGEVTDDDFQRIVIPISATQVNSIGGIEREAVIDVGPALIKPAPQRGPAYVAEHTVQSNETIASIAAAYSISPESLIAANDLKGVLAIGETLRIPRVSGVPHVVDDGETLNDIAARYGVSPDTIMTYAPNGLDQGQALVSGREIFIPGANLAGVSDVSVRGAADLVNEQSRAAAIIRDDRTNLRKGPGTNYDKITKLNAGERLTLLGRHEEWVKIEQSDGEAAWVAREVVIIPEDVWTALNETDDFPPPPPPPPVWVWPTYGDLTSGFGYRNFSVGTYHNGIDIANRQGTPIVAARSGTVIEAGWCSGYGYCVKMRHGDGITTEYGHMMSRPVVSEGQYVEAGELIGYMGSTYDRAGGGYSTGVHLHFTVKIDGTAVNPLRYLD